MVDLQVFVVNCFCGRPATTTVKLISGITAVVCSEYPWCHEEIK